MKTRATIVFAFVTGLLLIGAAPVFAQLGGVLNRAQQVREQEIGRAHV